MANDSILSNFAEEVGEEVQGKESTGHQRGTWTMDVMQTLKDFQIGNNKIFQSLEQQNQINQHLLQNLVQLQDQMHQVTSNVEKGEDSMNRYIPNRYHFSQGKGDSRGELYSRHKSNEKFS